MHHKRRRSKKQRAGCLMCKPQKGPATSAARAARPSDQRRMAADAAANDDARHLRYQA